MKKCTRCGKVQPYANFYINRSAPDGLTSGCSKCVLSGSTESNQKSWDKSPWLYILKKKKYNARASGIYFSLTGDWLEAQPKFCPYLGLDFVLESPGVSDGIAHELAPSFDRLDSAGGYTPDNTQIISWWANRSKGQLKDEDFRTYCLLVEERIGGRFD